MKHQDNPPLNKNHPPVAGAIVWERLLLERMKCPIKRFRKAHDLMNSEEGKVVSCPILSLSKRFVTSIYMNE